MATTIWLLRRHELTGGALGFRKVSDELAADFIKKGWAQGARDKLKRPDASWPKGVAEKLAKAKSAGAPAPDDPPAPDDDPGELPLEDEAAPQPTKRGRPRKAE